MVRLGKVGWEGGEVEGLCVRKMTKVQPVDKEITRQRKPGRTRRDIRTNGRAASPLKPDLTPST